ncbi:MAG: NAD(P)-dependent oxidoreductase, partial [Rhodospirillales bacterium]|nr:NAD(P)-dependent oxidoreductase [Rhodospirillales bacterium]
GRIIFASSAAVYGDQNTCPNGTNEQVAPNNAYAQQKHLREQLVLDHGGTVMRIGNVYGPGMSTENVLSDIIAQLDAPGPITVRDDTPIRDYVWVEDVAKGVLAILNTETTGIFNIGSGLGVSVRSLAQTILSCAGQANRTIMATSPTSTISNLVLDIRKTTSKIGWEPQTPLSIGIERLLHS